MLGAFQLFMQAAGEFGEAGNEFKMFNVFEVIDACPVDLLLMVFNFVIFFIHESMERQAIP